jgi:hypothetical protein
MEEYGRNFYSLWDMVEALGGSPGVHKGLVNGPLMKPNQVRSVNKPSNGKIEEAEEDTCKAVNAMLLISGAKKCQYGKLRDELANNYLLGTNQYPDTFEMAMCILGNH